MWGKKQGKIAATYSREPTTVDGQTDTHAGVLYLQSSVEEERWERDVIVITTTTTREKGQSKLQRAPHQSKNTSLGLRAGGTWTNWDLSKAWTYSTGQEVRGASELVTLRQQHLKE